MILAGDVGGTKTTLALFDVAGGRLGLVREATAASRTFPSLEAAIDRFLADGPLVPLDAVCVGIAGPVVDGRCVATNLAWRVDERDLVDALRVAPVRLINDLEATGHGIFALDDDALVPLQAGVARRGNVAVIAAGTGLGEAIVVAAGDARIVVATEGGHTDFAPRDDLETELLGFLRAEFGRVSYERILSGPGLHNVYRFLRARGVAAESPAVSAAMAAGDPGVVITEHGLQGRDVLCVRALEIFVSVYGAEAGNLALKSLAAGGVVLAGGIAPRILPVLQGDRFLRAFRDKGRVSAVLDAMPVHVALDPRAPLLGAAQVAATLR